jgi:hypothetical protein
MNATQVAQKQQYQLKKLESELDGTKRKLKSKQVHSYALFVLACATALPPSLIS